MIELRTSPSGVVVGTVGPAMVEAVFTRRGTGGNITNLASYKEPEGWAASPSTPWAIPAGKYLQIVASTRVEAVGTDGLITTGLEVETAAAPGVYQRIDEVTWHAYQDSSLTWAYDYVPAATLTNVRLVSYNASVGGAATSQLQSRGVFIQILQTAHV
jgi:hypothetical protein